jgi:hypothetical protein
VDDGFRKRPRIRSATVSTHMPGVHIGISTLTWPEALELLADAPRNWLVRHPVVSPKPCVRHPLPTHAASTAEVRPFRPPRSLTIVGESRRRQPRGSLPSCPVGTLMDSGAGSGRALGGETSSRSVPPATPGAGALRLPFFDSITEEGPTASGTGMARTTALTVAGGRPCAC